MDHTSRALCCALSIGAAAGAWCQAPVGPGGARSERLEQLSREVFAAESGFARTMADRDLDAFARFVADNAVFRNGDQVLIGRKAVVDGWRGRFKAGPAPFSWEPDRITVGDSEDTAISSGPVRDPNGTMIGRFTSVWQKQRAPDGARWRVIVDQGVPLAECSAPDR